MFRTVRNWVHEPDHDQFHFGGIGLSVECVQSYSDKSSCNCSVMIVDK